MSLFEVPRVDHVSSFEVPREDRLRSRGKINLSSFYDPGGDCLSLRAQGGSFDFV